MDELTHIVDGGIVKDTMPFFRSADQLAVLGVWSGGAWSPESPVQVRQYRDDTLVGIWRVAGVDYPSRRNADAVLLIEPQGETSRPVADDIFVFGEGAYHHLPVVDSSLVLTSDAAIEVGDAHHHGVAQVRDGQVTSVVVFYRGDILMDREETLPIWWRDQEFFVRLARQQAVILPHESWLASFDRDPEEALERFLDGRAYMGYLERNEGHELLFRLFHEGRADRLTALDRAIRSWLETYWGRAPVSVSAPQWTEMLRDVFLTITRLDLRETQAWLLSRYEQAHQWLRGFYLSDARDPEADLLRMLALSQRDQRLLPLWKRLCRLTEDRPRYFASLGLLGLRNLPDPHGEPLRELHPAVFSGIVDLANALETQVQSGREREGFWRREVRAIMARYPSRNDTYWRRQFQPLIEDDSEAARLLGRLLPNLRSALRRGRAGGRQQQQNNLKPPTSAERRRILEFIQIRALDEIRDEVGYFLAKHRYYAHQTGDAEYLVKTFSNISGKLRRSDPDWALALLREAFVWAPYNPFLWTQRAHVEIQLGHNDRAAALLWEAKRKFPENSVVRNSLAHLLHRQGMLDLAEMMYRQTTEDFPNNVVSRAGLAEVLKAQHRWQEAEDIYRQTIEDFPKNVVSRTGLAEILKAQQRWQEAEDIYRETIEAFPQNVVSRNGLAEVLKAQHRWQEAEDIYRQTIEDFPKNVVSQNGLAVLLLQRGQRQEGLNILHQTLEQFPADPVARGLLSRIPGGDIAIDDMATAYNELTAEMRQAEDDSQESLDTYSEEDAVSDIPDEEAEDDLEMPTHADDALSADTQAFWDLESPIRRDGGE